MQFCTRLQATNVPMEWGSITDHAFFANSRYWFRFSLMSPRLDRFFSLAGAISVSAHSGIEPRTCARSHRRWSVFACKPLKEGLSSCLELHISQDRAHSDSAGK